MPSTDPCQERRLEQERQKREKYLHWKVQETLSLAVPEQPIAEKVCAHGTCSLTSEELKAQSRQYKDKLRTNRILQVRAQEMLFASQRIAEFRDRKTKDSKMLINHLKEVWSEDQRRRIANLEEEYANACKSIGLSHDAAVLVERNKAAKEELLARQAEESRYWDTLRFEEAMQKEREQKELRERADSASALRRKIVESVSSIERSFARRYNHVAKPKGQEKEAYGCSQTVKNPVTHDVTREKMYSKLAGFPIDFKDTYLHSRFDVLQDRTNRPSSAVVSCPEQEEVNAWRAAEQQRESHRCERARQIELERLYNERKLERGTAAAAKLLNDQRIALLEQEVEEAFREEEREQDRLHAVTNLGICKRATSAGQQRRPVYTKHKISKPLSCPGLPHTSLTCSRCRSYVELTSPLPKPVVKEPTPELTPDCEPDGETGFNISVCPRKSYEQVSEGCSVITHTPETQQERTTESQPVIASAKKKPKSLQDHPVTIADKQDLSKIDIQGTRIQLVDHVGYQAQQNVQKEVEREFIKERLSNQKSADGRFTDEAGVILEPGVTKSRPLSPVQAETREISPNRAFELNTAQHEARNVLKQPHMKSPNKCPMWRQNGRTGNRQFNDLKRDPEDIAGPARRWRSREKEREIESCMKQHSDKPSPGKTRYHMELVQEAANVEKEVEQYYKGIHHKRPSRSAGAAVVVHQVTHDNGETQRPHRDLSNGTRPPFLSSGTVGYKKILSGPLPRSSRPTCESEGNEAATFDEEKVSFPRRVRENSTPQRGTDVEIVNENIEANVYASSFRERAGTRASDTPDINSKGMDISRSWAHPVRPQTGPVTSQEQRKALKSVNREKWATREDQTNDDQVLGKDLAPKGLRKDPSLSRICNNDVKSRHEKWNHLAESCPGTELLFEVGKPRENNTRKGNGSERQEKRVQEPKPRQKAAWKSYIDEKKQASRKNLGTPTGHRSIKSEPSSPPARAMSSSSKRPTDQQDDSQSKARSTQPVVVNPHARNCHTPAASVKSLPNARSKFTRDKSVPRSWKYPQTSFKGIEMEALENIRTRMKCISNRFHSPMTQEPRDMYPGRRNEKVSSSKETSGFSNENSTRRERPQKLDGTKSSRDAGTPHLNGNLAEEETRKDAGSKPNVADTLWKSGKFQDDYAKTMKQAKESSSGSGSSGISKLFTDRNYSKPWLSRSPCRRSLDEASLHNQRQNERCDSANRRTDHRSPLTRTRNKPWLSNSPSRKSPDRMIEDRDNHRQNHRTGSANHRATSRSPMTRSNVASLSSPKQSNWTNLSQLSPKINKSSPVKGRVVKKETTTKDPWEGQSLDFVLGSLAEQVRELDERIRSATVSSPALSASSSPDREVYVNRDKQITNQRTARPPDKLHKVRGSPSTCSVASSPERYVQETKSSLPAARNISRDNANANTRDKAALGGTYMDELKLLLKEISVDNPSPFGGKRVTSSPATQKMERDIHTHNVHRAELMCLMNKDGARGAKAKAEYVSSTLISANASRAGSVTCRRDTRETRMVMVENGRAPGANGQLEHGNGNANMKGAREEVNRTLEVRDVRETETYERRSVPQENGFREDNGVRRVLEKKLVQSRWTEQQAAVHSSRIVQERLERRTVGVRGCAPHQVIRSGQAVIREQLVKEVIENGLPSPERNGHGGLRKNAVTPTRDRNNLNDVNGKVAYPRQEKGAQECFVAHHGLQNGKPAANGFVDSQRREAAGNGHKLTTEDPRQRPVQQAGARMNEFALSNGTEKLRKRQPEVPLWGEGSPHCSASWRKGGVCADEADDRMLLSGSVDFSPWNTAKLPDIGTPQNVAEKRGRSKAPSPVAEDAGTGHSSPKFQRAAKPPHQLIRAVGQKPMPNGEYFLPQDAAPVHTNGNSMKTQARPNFKRPKAVPRGVDALWSLNDQDTALKPSAAQNGMPPPPRMKSPYEKSPPGRKKRRPASAPRSRLVKEQSASQEETPDSTQDELNYLPVIMAKDPESRQRVIERRKKALQLDMEHRQRLRNSRPSSARNSL